MVGLRQLKARYAKQSISLRPKGRGRKPVGRGGVCIERICRATFSVSFFELYTNNPNLIT